MLKEQLNFDNFDVIKIGLASPEKIHSWSYGEVKKAETINYRTFKPERDGLFCEKIFGPTRDWECSCGKYKWIKHKGIVCDRCGVEVTESKVRRERMAHIDLAVPVSHIWYLRRLPNRMGTFLNMKLNELEKVIYYVNYVIIDPGDTPLSKKQLLNDEEYQKYRQEYGNSFRAGIGAEAIKELLKEVDINKLAVELRTKIKETSFEATRRKIIKQVRVIDAFCKSNNKPEWMILDCIPIIPPDLRPLVPLEGGRFATSDLNDLYRRVINRNNRLKHIYSLGAPEVMIHNEKRLLQEAVDALFENGARGKVVTGAGNRPLKSLSDILRGKQGRFRQNLLGKRVDYSGRSVIVVGPELKHNQCGLPKHMALELFKPFIIRELINKGLAHTVKSAKKMVDQVRPEIWDVLEYVIKDHPVLLNRAPTLHRLGIQAFEPVLIEGEAIRIHPLVCAAFNADFDGDQMAVHIPLSIESQIESKVLMASNHNILSPAHGRPIVTPAQDMVLGCCYLTKEKPGDRGEGKIFSDTIEVIIAFDAKVVGLHARVKVRMDGELIETTVGRVMFNEVLPEGLHYINYTINKKELSDIIYKCYTELGKYKTVVLLDALKEIGFKYATLSGISISTDDMKIPSIKEELIENARKEVVDIEKQYKKGIITDAERYNKVIDIWTHVTDKVAEKLFDNLKADDFTAYVEGQSKFNPIFMMADSGARGSKQQIRQLAGMRGLMAKPQKKLTGQIGEIIESPIASNFREGLTVLEYFISTHGGRKGLADTALKTADAGYLTRKLVDVAHDVIVTEEDCGTLNGIRIGALKEGNEVIEPLRERIIGRVSLDNVVNLLTDEIIVRAGDMITVEQAQAIEDAGIERIRIRSVLTCEAAKGVCALCYGKDLSTSEKVEVGEAVGIVAAQSIGEPGTQLTLRTFHIGGIASRVVKQSRIVAKKGGKVEFHNVKTIKNKENIYVIVNRNAEISIRDEEGKRKENYFVPYGTKLRTTNRKKVSAGELVADWDPYTMPIIVEVSGKVVFEDIIPGITMHEELSRETGLVERIIIGHREEKHPQFLIVDSKGKKIATYPLPIDAHIVAENKQMVYPGDILAKIPQEIGKTRDITGGLPRVAELFEARKPKSCAVITEISGVVKLGEQVKGMTKILVKNETGMQREYFIPHGKHLMVYDGDAVEAGDSLTDGSINPHDILKVKGDKEVQEHLVNEIQEVYRLQGVGINDKHIEIIVRQMLRNIVVTNPGDTDLLTGEQVNKGRFTRENERILAEDGEPAGAKPILLGITKASLASDSFISSASFQETTRILTEAAMNGSSDPLKGLKENVIIGHLIPAGTGLTKELENQKTKSKSA
ncbi:MAG: DNA-directed RNA polymerase subunit beta' [bacterium]